MHFPVCRKGYFTNLFLKNFGSLYERPYRFHGKKIRKYTWVRHSSCHFLKKLGFTPCKAEQPLQGMELQEKEAQKD